MEDQKNIMEEIKKLIETELTSLLSVGLKEENLDNLGKLIDIHKDIENECYWKKKEEVYGNELRL